MFNVIRNNEELGGFSVSYWRPISQVLLPIWLLCPALPHRSLVRHATRQKLWMWRFGTTIHLTAGDEEGHEIRRSALCWLRILSERIGRDGIKRRIQRSRASEDKRSRKKKSFLYHPRRGKAEIQRGNETVHKQHQGNSLRHDWDT